MIKQMGGEYNDPKVTAMVERVGNKIVSNTEAGKSKYKFDFHVLADQRTINAFALPGGQIFITMGLLNLLKTEDELAGVLGNEIGHVIGRHSAEQWLKTNSLRDSFLQLQLQHLTLTVRECRLQLPSMSEALSI